MNKPNILLIFSDQHRSCDLGCYGNNEVITPNFDKFANSGAMFTNCISSSPVCVPARGTLLTGLMPNRHKAITNDLPIDTNLESIADVMNSSGYHTGYIGKWHLGGIPRYKPIRKGERLGFTEWKAYNCNHNYFDGYYYDENDIKHTVDGYEPVEQTNLALDFINRNKDKAWGLVLSYGTPHDPYFAVPDEYLKMYENRNVTLRGNVPEQILDTMDRYYDRDHIEKCYKGYYAHITALDNEFGRIIQALEETGQMENTIIVYTSDHGDMLGSQGMTNKQLPYFESINIPLIVCQKGVTINTVSEEIISLADLPVSILVLAGLSFKTKVDGQDLNKLFTDKEAQGAEYAYISSIVPCHQAAARGSDAWRGFKTKDLTYAASYDGEFSVLFNTKEDKLEMNNLVHNKEAAAHARSRLEKITEKYDEFLPWQEFIIKHGYLEKWNESQLYFKLPTLD